MEQCGPSIFVASPSFLHKGYPVLALLLPRTPCVNGINKMSRQRSRTWCLTINNFTEADIKALQALKTTYLIIGYEEGKEETPHIQGFLRLKNPMTMTALSKKLPRAHLEVNHGTPEQAAEYCKKEGRFEETGELQTASDGGLKEKARWARNIKLAEENKLEEIKEQDPAGYVRMLRNLKQIRTDAMAQVEIIRDDNQWFCGPPETGKSRKAHADYPNAYWKEPNKWWDGYQGQETVIIDDLEQDAAYMLHFIKRWADRYPVSGETKGGVIPLTHKRLVITSNYTPEEIWTNQQSQVAVRRRFQVTRFNII